MNRKSIRIFVSLALVVLTGLLWAGCAPAVETQVPPMEAPTTSPTRTTPPQPTSTPADVAPISNIARSNLQRDTSPVVPPADLQQLVAGNRAFALDFYRAIRARSGNQFFSPHSLSVALAMTSAGARGETAGQFADTLHFTLPQERLHPAFNALALELDSRSETSGAGEGQRFQLNVANSVWGQQGYAFLSDFLDVLALNYGSGLRLVDFATDPESGRLAINDWVNDQTAEKIKDLVPPGAITTDTRLVLANAIYFNAAWQFPFAENLTRAGEFTLLDEREISVPMMSLARPERLSFLRSEDFQAVSLPYLGNTVAMDILLPDEGTFDAFEAGLDAATYESILANLSSQNVLLSMPKFSFEATYSLNDTLAAMGMPAAFDPNLADFSGMDGTKDLYISDVLHKAFVAVDEAGTEAAAATAVIVAVESMPTEVIELKVDRPFIFVIRDIPTGAILFIGRVLDPTQ